MQLERALTASTSAGQRALTASMATHSVKLPRAANEIRGRIGLPNMSVRKVCVRQESRYCARVARASLGIDDSPRGESKQAHAKCEWQRFGRSCEPEARQMSNAADLICFVCTQRASCY